MATTGNGIVYHFVGGLYPLSNDICVMRLRFWQAHTMTRQALGRNMSDFPFADAVGYAQVQSTRLWKMGERGIFASVVVNTSNACAGYEPRAALNAPSGGAMGIHFELTG